MARYSETVKDTSYGRAVPGAKIYVFDMAGIAAVMTNDTGGAFVNPLTADSQGVFYFNAVDGAYRLEIHYDGIFKYAESAVRVGTGGQVWDAVAAGIAATTATAAAITAVDARDDSIVARDQILALRPISLKDYGALGEAIPTDPTALAAKIARDDAAFALARADIIATGRALYIPAGFYSVSVAPLTFSLSDYFIYQTPFCAGPRVFGDGQGKTVIDSRVPNGWVFDLDNDNPHTATFQGILGGSFGGMTILQTVNVANSNGCRVRVAYQFRFHDMQIIGLSGTGIKLRNDSATAGDLDANNQVSFTDIRVENCDGWGIDAGSNGANNENSFLGMDRVFIQNCGTAAQKTITGITAAATAVVTSIAHGFANDSKIYIGGVGIGKLGMSSINSYFSQTPYTVKNATANTFEVWNAAGTAPINSSGYGAWVSGGRVLPFIQTSGGLRLKGQIASINNCGWTINQNCSIYIEGGSGLGQDVRIQASTVENACGFGVLVQGVFNVNVDVMHVYSGWANNGGTPNYWGWLIDGTYTVCQNITLEQMTPRSTVSDLEMVAFQCFGANADKSTIRVRNTTWKQWGYPNQYRFLGIDFDAIAQNGNLELTNTTLVRFRPKTSFSAGNSTPIRLSYGIGGISQDGEWVSHSLSTGGLTIAPTLAITGTTSVGSPVVTGINVETKRLVVGSPVTSANFVASTIVSIDSPTQITISNNATVAGSVAITVGLAASTLFYAYLYADVSFTLLPRLMFSSAVPVLDASGYMVKTGDPTALWVGTVRTDASNLFAAAHNPGTYSKTFDWPSIAAGATATTTITNCFGVFFGDIVTGVSMSISSGGLILNGRVNANSVIDVSAYNPTAGAIDLASAELRAIRG